MAAKKSEICLYKTFHRKLACVAVGFEDAIMHMRAMTSTGDILVNVSSFQKIGQPGAARTTVDVLYESLCNEIDEQKFLINQATLMASVFAKMPIKETEVRVTVSKPDGGEEKLEILGIIHMFTCIIFEFEFEFAKYVTEDDEITFNFEFDIYVYQFVQQTTLQDLCFASLSFSVSLENVFEILAASQVCWMKELFTQCLEFMVLHLNQLERRKEFFNLKDQLKNFIISAENPTFLEELIYHGDDEDDDGNDSDMEEMQ